VTPSIPVTSGDNTLSAICLNGRSSFNVFFVLFLSFTVLVIAIEIVLFPVQFIAYLILIKFSSILIMP
jgi:hypothetical protein